MAHLYDVGTGAWQPDPTEGWIASEVEQKLVKGEQVKLVFRLANGEVPVDRLRVVDCREGHMLIRSVRPGLSKRPCPLSKMAQARCHR